MSDLDQNKPATDSSDPDGARSQATDSTGPEEGGKVAAEPAPEQPISLKMFFLVALLWLPLSFFFWFLWASVFVAPSGFAVEWVLDWVLGDHLRGLAQVQHQIQVEVYFIPPDGTRIVLDAMIYGWGLPLLVGLAISTPNPHRIRWLQFFIGWLVVTVVQVWGLFWETLWQLSRYAGPEGAALIASLDIPPALIYQAYQFGVLVFPGVIPAALWILMNRRFIEALLPNLARRFSHPQEPRGPGDGQ